MCRRRKGIKNKSEIVILINFNDDADIHYSLETLFWKEKVKICLGDFTVDTLTAYQTVIINKHLIIKVGISYELCTLEM